MGGVKEHAGPTTVTIDDYVDGFDETQTMTNAPDFA